MPMSNVWCCWYDDWCEFHSNRRGKLPWCPVNGYSRRNHDVAEKQVSCWCCGSMFMFATIHIVLINVAFMETPSNRLNSLISFSRCVSNKFPMKPNWKKNVYISMCSYKFTLMSNFAAFSRWEWKWGIFAMLFCFGVQDPSCNRHVFGFWIKRLP